MKMVRLHKKIMTRTRMNTGKCESGTALGNGANSHRQDANSTKFAKTFCVFSLANFALSASWRWLLAASSKGGDSCMVQAGAAELFGVSPPKAVVYLCGN